MKPLQFETCTINENDDELILRLVSMLNEGWNIHRADQVGKSVIYILEK